jgi:hypothetical protein
MRRRGGGVVPTRLNDPCSGAARASLPGICFARRRIRALRRADLRGAAERLLEAAACCAMRRLKFEMCMDVCGVDYLEHGRAEWKTRPPPRRASAAACRARPAGSMARRRPARPRFAVVYHLLSVSLNQRCACACFAPTMRAHGGFGDRHLGLRRIGSSAKPSTCSASCSRAIRICAACSPTTASSAIRSARIFRCRAMSRCATTRRKAAWCISP